MMVVALIDGPLPVVMPACRHRHLHCQPHPDADRSPAARHAGQMAAAIMRNAPGVAFDSHVVFPGHLNTFVVAVCEALERAARSDARIVQCSFGIARNPPELVRAVAAVRAAGKWLVASAPARGAPVYPAGCDGVVAVQGDARCGPAQWSRLDLPHARFGACPTGPDPAIRGASIAAAHFTGLLAREHDAGRADLMPQTAPFQGRERIPAS
ncbi:hypothetical protein [Pukyongiella litopenaei]|uniref:Peptidase S8/S53 domain-containing protein n=1 Tax=Pukyongiella litopenaei TaxID=2605946 RepID=A0A2S0MKA6_9RHOB|nr:hypothetical protein [Pukyongiella litopenaei]AVO36324.1 hypothetical protein C6Y53_00425 [Pukyongiella litopenaei]